MTRTLSATATRTALTVLTFAWLAACASTPESTDGGPSIDADGAPDVSGAKAGGSVPNGQGPNGSGPNASGPNGAAGSGNSSLIDTSTAVDVEQCDGLDNDGDGVVDEQCSCAPGIDQKCFVGAAKAAGIGSCGMGVQRCELRKAGEFSVTEWTACEGYGAATAETCNGVDDDCNGTIDDGCLCEDGQSRACSSACGQGEQSCTSGRWGACSAKQPSVEACNGVDDDCDGEVDEALTRPCSSGCGVGVERCEAGAWAGCTATKPAPEQCNGVDDDCDGEVDEAVDEQCSSACGSGVRACVGGKIAACDAPIPTSEQCTGGSDEDCDGAIDCDDSDCLRDVACKPACDPSQTTVKAEQLPLDLYFMVDRSSSMGSDCNVGSATSSKWCYQVNALDGYFRSSAAAGNAVALQYFPQPGYACGGWGGTSAYPEVNLGVLPANATALRTSLNGTAPSGTNTPTESAIRGLADFTAWYRRSGRVMVGVLITDGEPNGCSESGTTLAGLIGGHLSAEGIKTFVVGMNGADFTLLDTLAKAGGASKHSDYCATGTSSCSYYNVGTGSPAAFIAALQAIQKDAVRCEYAVPAAAGSDALAVTVNSKAGKTALSEVGSAASCGSGKGFYVDDPSAPTTFTLCPSACDLLRADSAGTVDVARRCD